MTLLLHRASRADALADALGTLLAVPLDDPFATEVVVVPAKGVERWLSQRLSHVLGASAAGDGVCAGVEFRSPPSLIAEITGLREADPWSAEAMVWPLLEVIDESLDETWAGTLSRHLGHGLTDDEADLRVGRRFAVARRLAGLFASYAVQRPTLIADWSGGVDSDGVGGVLEDDLLWQPELWRRLTAKVDAPIPPIRVEETVSRLRESPDEFELPPRLSLFGHTRLARSEVSLLGALAHGRDVHLWLPHPSPALWSALSAELDSTGAIDRVDDASHLLAGHRLLATLGRDTRELQRSLSVLEVEDRPVPEQDTEGPNTLLRWLQADLRAGGRVAGPPRRWVKSDRSVQVHACHGLARQVDVLREVIVGLLADDPSLEPRDVLVMCPDIETFAPLIAAGFGLHDVVGDAGHPAHRLRVSLADRALSQTNPLLAVAHALLDLAGGRAEASRVLDLAHAEPVRRRFGFTDDNLAQLEDWIRQAGVRWAFDAEHRVEYGLGGVVANTWEFGVDRLLAGVALSDDSDTWLDRTLPLDDVGSSEVGLVGVLAEYVDRLRSATDKLVGARPLRDWLDLISEGVAGLALVGASDAWQQGQLQRELGRIREASAHLGDIELRLPDVRAMVGERLGGRPTRANFRTGTMTVCTMVPMRSVPHRVVCLLGLDDGVFPRVGVIDGDDALARRPQTGERDARSEDRQLMLDAVLAATETLVITYAGANEYSGAPRPPAVPLGELLDALDETAETDGRVSAAVTTRHPLQPFDPRNLSGCGLVDDGLDRPFSFDRTALAGARAATAPRVATGPFLAAPLPPTPTEDLALDEVLSFYKHPVRGFLRTRLDVALPDEVDDLDDTLPIALDQLQQWTIGDRVLRDLLAGHRPDDVRQREWRRGELPPGRLGWRLLDSLVTGAGPIAAEATQFRTGSARSVDIDVRLPDGRRLRGTVPSVYGDRLVGVNYSRLGASHRLQAWIGLLALSASDPDRAWSTRTIGRPPNSRSRSTSATSILGPLDHRAIEWLADLVALRDRGLCAPLPLPIKASLRYAGERRTRADAGQALRQANFSWQSDRFPGEDADPAHVIVYGPGADLPGLDETAGPGEEFAGEFDRFGALALRVWSPLLEAEQGSW